MNTFNFFKQKYVTALSLISFLRIALQLFITTPDEQNAIRFDKVYRIFRFLFIPILQYLNVFVYLWQISATCILY